MWMVKISLVTNIKTNISDKLLECAYRKTEKLCKEWADDFVRLNGKDKMYFIEYIAVDKNLNELSKETPKNG